MFAGTASDVLGVDRMLNPAFCLLDPELDHLEKLMSLSGDGSDGLTWQAIVGNLEADQKKRIVDQTVAQLTRPGIHPQEEITRLLRQAAKTQGVETPEPRYFNWPEAVFRRLFNQFAGPARVYVLGILDAEGIWAGGIVGASHQGLDFLSTFRLIWSDEPELASRQTLDDLTELCQVVEKRFSMPVCGLYVYKDEFIQWRSSGWSRTVFDRFVALQTMKTSGF